MNAAEKNELESGVVPKIIQTNSVVPVQNFNHNISATTKMSKEKKAVCITPGVIAPDDRLW